MDKRKIRDILRFASSLFFCWVYLPHLFLYRIGRSHGKIIKDVERTGTDSLRLRGALGLIYLLHTDRYFRKLFYYRIGALAAMLIGWWRPGDKYFIISNTSRIGGGVFIAHPYSTVLNAESIGENFSCIHCTTLGKKNEKRPIIGDNVSLGANVIIIGGIHVGNNVKIGAGSVVVKDIPDNCVVAGNPAKVIKTIDNV